MSKYFLLKFGKTPTQFRAAIQTQEAGGRTDRTPTAHTPALLDERKSIAVISFENVSKDEDQNFLGVGIAEEILNGLLKVANIKVARSSYSLLSQESVMDVQSIGEERNVDYCLFGSARIEGSSLRLIVQLMDVYDGFLVWTERYVVPLQNIFEIQDEIATKIIRKLKVTLQPNEKSLSPIKRKTQSVAAYQFYLRGKHEFELRNDLNLCIHQFQLAITEDKNFAQAYFGIAFALIYKCIFNGESPRQTLPLIEAAYESAIIINNSIPETYIIKAWIYFYFYHDIARAIQYMDKSIAIDDQLMDAYRIKAYFLAFSGRYDEGLVQAHVAYELDPNGFNAWFSLADIYRRSRRYDEAITLFEPLLAAFPKVPIVKETLGLSYFHIGRIEDAGKLLQIPDTYPTTISLYNLAPYFLQHHLGEGTPLSGLLRHLTALQKSQYVQPSILALISFHLNKTADALAYLKDAERQLDFGLKHIVSEPYWDLYRDHLQVQESLRVVGMV